MNGYSHLGRETATAHQALAVALDDHPDLSEDDVALVINSESNLEAAIGAAVRRVIELDAVADAAMALSRSYKARAERKKAAVDRGRTEIREALENLGLRRMVLPEATISIGHGQPGVVVTDEALVPARYRRADPRVEAAYEQLLRAAAFAASSGHEEMQADFQGTAEALLAHFTLDRKAISQALKEGATVTGAALGNGSSWLVVRTA